MHLPLRKRLHIVTLTIFNEYLIVTVITFRKYLIVTITISKKYLIVKVTMFKKHLIVTFSKANLNFSQLGAVHKPPDSMRRGGGGIFNSPSNNLKVQKDMSKSLKYLSLSTSLRFLFKPGKSSLVRWN
jgi:hypothetical protein